METRGDVLIQGLWESHTDAITDVIFGDADADIYKYDPTEKLLASWEKENNNKQGKNYHEQWKIFLRFPYQWMECSGRRL